MALAPNFAEGWNKRATTLYTMGRFEDSAGISTRCWLWSLGISERCQGWVLCNIQLGRDREALAAFQRAAGLDPNLAGVQANLDALKKRLIKNFDIEVTTE